MIIDIEALTGETQLWFATKGVEVREQIIEAYRNSVDKKALELDLQKIEVADASFIREAFVKLISELSFESHRPQLVFRNVSDYLLENLEASFSKREKFGLFVNEGNWNFFGKYSEPHRATMEALVNRGEITAKGVAEVLDIKLTALNNRLSSMYDMCVVYRTVSGQETGGKEYLYSAKV